jgi:CRISPR-associated endonuclease/helicase Cas3
MLIRAEIERELDATLKRHQPEAVFSLPDIRDKLDTAETDHLFIVLATAVAEVGRDHCYDWAIVEPSSMRSIIQLAGRVKRHRGFDCPPDQPNILLLDTNVKQLKRPGRGAAFCRPGFESEEFPSPAIPPRAADPGAVADHRRPSPHPPRGTLDARRSLVDLEHARLADLMLGAADGHQRQIPANWWWTTQAHLSGILQARTRFRADPQGHQSYYLQPDEDATSTTFTWLEESGKEITVESNLLLRLNENDLAAGPASTPGRPPTTSPRCKPWPKPRAWTRSTAPASSAPSTSPPATPCAGATTRRWGSAGPEHRRSFEGETT